MITFVGESSLVASRSRSFLSNFSWSPFAVTGVATTELNAAAMASTESHRAGRFKAIENFCDINCTGISWFAAAERSWSVANSNGNGWARKRDQR
jgi:hypothetical protein